MSLLVPNIDVERIDADAHKVGVTRETLLVALIKSRQTGSPVAFDAPCPGVHIFHKPPCLRCNGTGKITAYAFDKE